MQFFEILFQNFWNHISGQIFIPYRWHIEFDKISTIRLDTTFDVLVVWSDIFCCVSREGTQHDVSLRITEIPSENRKRQYIMVHNKMIRLVMIQIWRTNESYLDARNIADIFYPNGNLHEMLKSLSSWLIMVLYSAL